MKASTGGKDMACVTAAAAYCSQTDPTCVQSSRQEDSDRGSGIKAALFGKVASACTIGNRWEHDIRTIKGASAPSGIQCLEASKYRIDTSSSQRPSPLGLLVRGRVGEYRACKRFLLCC